MTQTVYLATLDGQPTTAKMCDGRWMVGGDFDTRGTVQIILNVHGRPAWHTLRGCFLKFSDFATEQEVAAIKETVK